MYLKNKMGVNVLYYFKVVNLISKFQDFSWKIKDNIS